MDLADRLVANLFFLFKEYVHRDRFARARHAGFAYVEDPSPYDLTAAEYAAAARDAGVRVAALNTPAGDAVRGDFGLAALPGREADFRESFEEAVAYVTACGAPIIHVMVGVVGEDVAPAEAGETLVANLKWAAARAAGFDRRLIMETINAHDKPGWFVNTTAHAVEVIEAVGADNLGLLFDIYHLHRMGEDVLGRVREIGRYIFHVQVGSLPERHEPVGGEVPLPALLAALEEAGYRGKISAEYNPATTTEEGISWVRDYGLVPH